MSSWDQPITNLDLKLKPSNQKYSFSESSSVLVLSTHTSHTHTERREKWWRQRATTEQSLQVWSRKINQGDISGFERRTSDKDMGTGCTWISRSCPLHTWFLQLLPTSDFWIWKKKKIVLLHCLTQSEQLGLTVWSVIGVVRCELPVEPDFSLSFPRFGV